MPRLSRLVSSAGEQSSNERKCRTVILCYLIGIGCWRETGPLTAARWLGTSHILKVRSGHLIGKIRCKANDANGRGAVGQGGVVCDTMAIIIPAPNASEDCHEQYYRHHQRPDCQPPHPDLHEGCPECSAVRLLRPGGTGVDELWPEIRLRGHPAESGYARRAAQVRQLAHLPAAVGQGGAGRWQRHHSGAGRIRLPADHAGSGRAGLSEAASGSKHRAAMDFFSSRPCENKTFM